jgi:hypothetical protein
MGDDECEEKLCWMKCNDDYKGDKKGHEWNEWNERRGDEMTKRKERNER